MKVHSINWSYICIYILSTKMSLSCLAQILTNHNHIVITSQIFLFQKQKKMFTQNEIQVIGCKMFIIRWLWLNSCHLTNNVELYFILCNIITVVWWVWIVYFVGNHIVFYYNMLSVDQVLFENKIQNSSLARTH